MVIGKEKIVSYSLEGRWGYWGCDGMVSELSYNIKDLMVIVQNINFILRKFNYRLHANCLTKGLNGEWDNIFYRPYVNEMACSGCLREYNVYTHCYMITRMHFSTRMSCMEVMEMKFVVTTFYPIEKLGNWWKNMCNIYAHYRNWRNSRCLVMEMPYFDPLFIHF